LWAGPYFNIPERLADPGPRGFSATRPGIKILWIVKGGLDLPLEVTVSSLDGGYTVTHTFDPPGRNREDRPTDFRMPPPGCYRFIARVGERQGEVINEVLP
jgi:hypothetical protein